MTIPQHERAVRLHHAHGARLDDLKPDLGLTRWCLQLLADESPLRSPSLEPGRGSDTSDPTASAALSPDPDPLLEDARAWLAWVQHGEGWKRARTAVVRIRDGLAGTALLSRPCVRCGRQGEQMRGDTCKRCDQEARRERERVA